MGASWPRRISVHSSSSSWAERGSLRLVVKTDLSPRESRGQTRSVGISRPARGCGGTGRHGLSGRKERALHTKELLRGSLVAFEPLTKSRQLGWPPHPHIGWPAHHGAMKSTDIVPHIVPSEKDDIKCPVIHPASMELMVKTVLVPTA